MWRHRAATNRKRLLIKELLGVMKFCKSLQRVASISDPSYAPYWTNYKLLKKKLKAISGRDSASIEISLSDPSMDSPPFGSSSPKQRSPQFLLVSSSRKSAGSVAAAAASPPHVSSTARKRERSMAAPPPPEEDVMSALELDDGVQRNNSALRTNPHEVAFFRLLHAEVKKAIDFFDKVERECIIREQVVTVGMEILKKPQASVVKDRWSVISRAVFFLYRDLLLLETFAIMTYFSFSKILKKHDKVTGYSTRDPFMVNIVNKANFTNYPKIMELIGRCQTLYNEASEKLVQDLYEDERLFLNMVSEWNSRNREAGGAGRGGEVTEGLRSDTVQNVSHRSRTEATTQVETQQKQNAPSASSSRPVKKRDPQGEKPEDTSQDEPPKKPRPSK